MAPNAMFTLVIERLDLAFSSCQFHKGVNLDLWAEHEDTPIWLMFSHWDGVPPIEDVRQALGDALSANTSDSVPVHLPTGVEKDRVLAEVLEFFTILAGRIAGRS